MKKLLVYGASEFGQVVKPLAEACGFQVTGYVDDVCEDPGILCKGRELPEGFAPTEYSVAIAIGYRHLDARRQIAERLLAVGYEIPALIHPRAYVAGSASIAAGAFVMAGCSVDVRAKIETLVVMWPGAIVSHDAVVRSNTFLSPGAIVCGASEIGIQSFIGAGAIVTDHVTVPAGSFVKAGARYDPRRGEA